MTAPQRFAEIEIRGHITFTPDDPESRAFLTAAAEADRRPDYGVIRAEEIAAQLDALAAQGVRVVLIRYASAGGAHGAAKILSAALRRFQAGGGKIISYVETAGSTAVVPALEGDAVLMMPGGKFLVHGSLRTEGVDAREVEGRRAISLAWSLERMAARTATPSDKLREWLSVYEDEHAINVVELVFRDALNFGWADYSVPLEVARGVAEFAAGGHMVGSPRAALLASRAAGNDATQVLFGQGLATCSQPSRRAYPRKRRPLPTAPASADCATCNVGNGAVVSRHIEPEAVTGEKLAVDALQTSNYAEDGSGNPTAGAKLDHQGTALKVAPANLQLGKKVLSRFGLCQMYGFANKLSGGSTWSVTCVTDPLSWTYSLQGAAGSKVLRVSWSTEQITSPAAFVQFFRDGTLSALVAASDPSSYVDFAIYSNGSFVSADSSALDCGFYISVFGVVV